MKYEKLFTPIDLGPIHVKNRIFMSPMHPNLSETPDGVYTKRFIDYFAERAKKGVGLIMTGHVKAERTIDPYPCQYKFPCLDRVDEVKYFAELCDAVHLYGAKIVVELSAGTGRVAPSLVDGFIPGGPSEVPMLYVPGVNTRELTKDEIHKLAEAYGVAAGNAKAAGFDAIYVHAHSYLLDQFLTPAWNHRTDEYGGCIENRMRFLMECIDSARRYVGDDYPLIGGFSMDEGIENGKSKEDWIAIAKALEAKGVVALYVKNGSYDGSEKVMPSSISPTRTSIDNAAFLKSVVSIPVMTDGALLDPDSCEEVLQAGKIDMTGIGRPLLADADWAIKAKAGKPEDIRPCLRCMECLNRSMTGLFSGCSVNPVMGRESEQFESKALTSKKVLVVGGGQSGMLSAIYASQRGHKVILVEEKKTIGGHLRESAMPFYKDETRRYMDWILRELNKTDVEIQTGIKVDKSYVDSIKPDSIIICTGSTPIKPNIPGNDNAKVHFATDALMDKSLVGNKVVIIGSGLVGIETALDCVHNGKDVTLVEMMPEIGPDLSLAVKYSMLGKVMTSHIKCMPSTKLTAINDKGAIVNNDAGEQLIEADTVLLAVGLRAENKLYDELILDYPEVYIVGDAIKARRFFNANREAYTIAKTL